MFQVTISPKANSRNVIRNNKYRKENWHVLHFTTNRLKEL